MSSAIDYGLLYDRITTVVVPIILVLGIVTNALNIVVLSRRALLQKSPCTHYFLTLAIISIILMITGPGFQFAGKYFKFRPSASVAGCKLSAYVAILLIMSIGTLLTLATWDRFCQSSTSTRVRRWSSVKLARRSIIGMLILIAILLSPTLFIWYINDAYGGICLSYTDRVSTIVAILLVIIVDCLPPLMMTVFGLLTIRNIRGERHRVAPAAHGVGRSRRTEMQLARMLLWQVLDYLIFFLPVSITYVLVVVNSSWQTAFFGFVINICTLWYYSFCSTPFFLYILTASVYRREFTRIVCRRSRVAHQEQTRTNTLAMNPAHTDRTVIQ